MKFIHSADWHIGAGQIGPMDTTTRMNGRVLDYLDMLDSMIDFAEEEFVDIAFFSGDAFHKNNPSAELVNALSKRIGRLSKLCPIVLVVGNHDVARMDKTSIVKIYDSLNVPNVIVGDVNALHIIDTKSGKIQVVTIPFPSKHILHLKAFTTKVLKQSMKRFKST
jgi:exonuclease SbcD